MLTAYRAPVLQRTFVRTPMVFLSQVADASYRVNFNCYDSNFISNSQANLSKIVYLIYPSLMAIDLIVAQIDAEIARLTQARALLAGFGLPRRCGSPIHECSPKTKKKKKHVLSPEARKRIADAQHKRWAAHKAKSKSKK